MGTASHTLQATESRTQVFAQLPARGLDQLNYLTTCFVDLRCGHVGCELVWKSLHLSFSESQNSNFLRRPRQNSYVLKFNMF